MREPYSEGIALHTGPESCGQNGNILAEALTGEDAGRELSRESFYYTNQSADAVENVGRQHWSYRYAQDTPGLCAVEDPEHVRKLFARELGAPITDLNKDGSEVRATNPRGVIW